jgi:hypothetical protein
VALLFSKSDVLQPLDAMSDKVGLGLVNFLQKTMEYLSAIVFGLETCGLAKPEEALLHRELLTLLLGDLSFGLRLQVAQHLAKS